MGSRQSDFKKSFQISIQSILTAASKEDVDGAFLMHSNAEKESLYRLFIQVNNLLQACDFVFLEWVMKLFVGKKSFRCLCIHLQLVSKALHENIAPGAGLQYFLFPRQNWRSNGARGKTCNCEQGDVLRHTGIASVTTGFCEQEVVLGDDTHALRARCERPSSLSPNVKKARLVSLVVPNADFLS
ncbi:hypothetical protein IEQ34_000034 [Dendrobium chrysotoxum]|uniref:Uncharacterized protein n=1 Tax=Dendrobium chrysotoxum TaxID=161865 RepID=A0AAV7HME3_DENCH|nr:hypothetical protein IEQ34_000034 [Dendrobium chrysotoxum]